MIRLMLRSILFSLLLSSLTSNAVVYAVPTPSGHPAKHLSSLPVSNDNDLVPVTQDATPLNALHLHRHDALTSNPHTKRFPLGNLLVSGTRLIFQNFDLVVATALAVKEMKEFYQACARLYASSADANDVVTSSDGLNDIITISYGVFTLVSWYEQIADVEGTRRRALVLEALMLFARTMGGWVEDVVMLPFRCWVMVQDGAKEAVWVGVRLMLQED
ncbi:MAG: hypothetical protein Q9169_001953 [Polycauliona sp. 2 TL-2023]